MGEQLLQAYSREELVEFDPTLPAFEAALAQVVGQIEAFERQQRARPVAAELAEVKPVTPQEKVMQPTRQTLGLAIQGLAQSLLGFL